MLKEKYQLSLNVAAPLVECVTHQPPGAVVVASGTSCRHQIHDLTPIRPKHMAELLADALQEHIHVRLPCSVAARGGAQPRRLRGLQ